jgi:hypothetical protein
MCELFYKGRISEDIDEHNGSRKHNGRRTRSTRAVNPAQQLQRKEIAQRLTNPHNASSALTDGDVRCR